jgi:uncharacterized membrane protein YesL
MKINTIADWIIRFVVINIIVITLSIPLITLYPAMSAGYNLFHDYANKDEVKLINGYFGYFKEHFGKKLLLGVMLSIILYLGYTNVTYYVQILSENNNWFYLAGYYITSAFLAVAIVVTLLSVTAIKVFPEAKLLVLLKLSFFLMGKFFLRALLLIVITVLPFAMLLLPVTTMIFVFAGISIPLFLNVIITKPIVLYLEKLGEQND